MTASAAALGRRELVSTLALRFGNITPATEILGAYVEAISLVAVMLGLIGDREMADLFLSYAETFGGPAAPEDPTVRSWLNYAIGRLGAALRAQPYRTLLAFQTSAAAFHVIGDRRMIAVATADLSLTLARLGRPREAERKLREVLQLAQQLDEPITLTWVQMYLALILAERGDAEALAEARQLALAILRTIGERSYYSGVAYCALAAVERAGNQALAEQHATRAIEILSATMSSAPLGYIALANVHFAAGHIDAAARAAERGLKLCASIGGGGSAEVPLRVLHVAALRQLTDREALAAAETELEGQLARRAADIEDAELRASYLARLQDHARSPLLF
ncbi:MAG: hypothetical protein U1A78_00565 [Polyangia bacterium]